MVDWKKYTDPPQGRVCIFFIMYLCMLECVYWFVCIFHGVFMYESVCICVNVCVNVSVSLCMILCVCMHVCFNVMCVYMSRFVYVKRVLVYSRFVHMFVNQRKYTRR
jgi:hypothetical protein